MKTDINMLTVLAGSPHMLLISFMGQAMGYIVYDALFEKKRSMWKLIVFIFCKTILIVIVDVIIKNIFSGADWTYLLSAAPGIVIEIILCAMLVYDTRHAYFVVKEQFASRIGVVFGKIFHELDQRKKQLRFVVKGNQMICLAPEEIYYFERNKRKTILETVWGSYELHDRMDALMNRLPSGEFIRCHNSYIVYLPNVKEIQKDIFCMKNGVRITVSRGYAKETKAALTKWVLAQMS